MRKLIYSMTVSLDGYITGPIFLARRPQLLAAETRDKPAGAARAAT